MILCCRSELKPVLCPSISSALSSAGTPHRYLLLGNMGWNNWALTEVRSFWMYPNWEKQPCSHDFIKVTVRSQQGVGIRREKMLKQTQTAALFSLLNAASHMIFSSEACHLSACLSIHINPSKHDSRPWTPPPSPRLPPPKSGSKEAN